MTEMVQLFDRLHPSDRVALLAHATKTATDKDLKSSLRDSFDRLIKSTRPLHTADEVHKAISSCHGTALEPFVIGEDNLKEAVRFVRLCLSKQSDAKAVRLISESSLGTRGGLLLDRDLNTVYVERFLERDKKHGFADSSYWAMGSAVNARSLEELVAAGFTATCVPDEKYGYRVDITCGSPELQFWDKVSRRPYYGGWQNRVVSAAHCVGSGTSLKDIGCQMSFATTEPETVRLIPATPEALVRFSALLVTQAELIFPPVEDDPLAAELRITLHLPEDRPGPLPVELKRVKPGLGDTLRLDDSVELEFQQETVDDIVAAVGCRSLFTNR